MAFGLRRAKMLNWLSVKLVSKISNLCDPDSTTLQGDGRTNRQTTCNLNTALCTIVHRAVKISKPILTGLPAYQLDRLQSAVSVTAHIYTELLGMINWSCYVLLKVASAWEDTVQALCTCFSQVHERRWVGLPRRQSTASDGRPVTSTPAVVFVVNAGRPGDTSYDIGRPFNSCRHRSHIRAFTPMM